MKDEIMMLSHRRVSRRKEAIVALVTVLKERDDPLARLSLHYVSEHDPCYTIRNLARQAFYKFGSPPPSGSSWERAYSF